ncbi:DeoR/GlpR family DNA-binding transcription regulator [Hoeflea sp. BAL378]|uniref:DeoR/GlpR family DNA-binding transcription regulator n=1 Tax=Hoeflea sp. BAL378 TaxID=1547437 RepID=UPI00068F5142|nr:DeoR/GlpR family DNA-binding transcription regulator [Hoeflea sp. BAL378]
MNLAAMDFTPRQLEIAALIQSNGFMRVEALADRFGVTPQTIRRDINLLCDGTVLRRRHGGAASLVLSNTNLSYDHRQVTNPGRKRIIAARVARLVPNHASVALGNGTTPEFVAQALAGHEDLTVLTSNLNVAMALSVNGSHHIILPGGAVRLPDRDLLGRNVEAMFRDYRVDFGIFGVGGIEPDGALVDFDRSEVMARQALMESCRTSILVVDASKFGRPAPARGGHFSDADIVVLDSLPPPSHLAGHSVEGDDQGGILLRKIPFTGDTV